MQTNDNKNVVALYMRSAQKDEQSKESENIEAQRETLVTYANENDFIIFDEYVDDGWSGTNFERPDFKRMLQDIENNHINIVITKDLSCLGRDTAIVKQYIEDYFPSKGVRFIAVNDGHDSNAE